MTDIPTSDLPRAPEPAMITAEMLDAEIVSRHFFTAFEGTVQSGQNIGEQSRRVVEALKSTVFCTLVLRNGFSVTGKAMCLHRPSFDREAAQQGAHNNAIGIAVEYLYGMLRDRLAQAPAEDGKAAAHISIDPPPINSADGQNIVQIGKSTKRTRTEPEA